MSSVRNLRYGWGRSIVAAALAGLLGSSLPVSAFSQEAQKKTEPAATAPAVKPTQTPVATQENRPAEGTGIVAAAPGRQQTQDAQAQNQIMQPLALSPEVTKQRVGINLDQRLALTLQEAIAMSLQNNLGIEQARQSVQINQYSLFATRGVYDIVVGAESSLATRISPITSIFVVAGGDQSTSVASRSIDYNFNASQFVEKTGAFWRVDFQNARTASSSTGNTLNNQYSPSVNFQFTQPLLRNFKIDANRRSFQIAKRQLDLSDSQFRQRVIDIINSVQRAYWDLVYAIRADQIARDSVSLTREQLENNRKMVEAGTLAPIELRSTEAALESRKQSVVDAVQGVNLAENALKNLMLKDPVDKAWSAWVDPTDQPQLGQTSFSLTEATVLALKNRPELEQMRLQNEQKQVDIHYFENQTKPLLEFVANYGTSGIAGSEREAGRANDRFVGGYFQALRNLLGQDFRNYDIGFRISFPLRNRTAESNLGRSLAEARQLDAQQRQLVQTISVDVRNALQALEAANQRYQAARANVVAAEAQLAGEQERYRAGLSQNFLVLNRQTDLAIAQGSEVRAKTDYNKAVADVQRVTGMTLVSNNVKVPTTPGGGGK